MHKSNFDLKISVDHAKEVIQIDTTVGDKKTSIPVAIHGKLEEVLKTLQNMLNELVKTLYAPEETKHAPE